jgi:ADP-ribose pyrophosphatase
MQDLPTGAQKVFDGVIFDVYHWQQEQFDGTTKTFECIKRPNIAVIVPIIDGKILIMREEQPGRPPYWGLPAGRFDREEEDPLTVAKREFLEETGMVSDSWRLIHEHSNTLLVVGTTYVFAAEACSVIQEPQLDQGGEKIHETKLVTFDEFLHLHVDETFKDGALETIVLRALLDPSRYAKLKQDIFGV